MASYFPHLEVKYNLIVEPGNLDQNFPKMLRYMYMALSLQPVELQKTTASKFGVAFGAQQNGQVKNDLRSP